MNQNPICPKYSDDVQQELTGMHLDEEDILYFLHIPKTAGTSLIDFLDSHFAYTEILRPKAWLELLPNMPQSFAGIRCVRGHFGYWIYRILPRKPVYITMLRDPKEVVVSAYKMIQRQPEAAERYSIPQNKTLSELITEPATAGMKNFLCHWLAADFDMMSITRSMTLEELRSYYPEQEKAFRRPELSDNELLEIAKTHLSECAFVGLTDMYEQSLLLLCYTFGWKPVRWTAKVNVAPPDPRHGEINIEARQRLAKSTRADEKLYAHGREIFESNYAAMQKELRDKYYDPSLSRLDSLDLLYELLNRRYEENFATTKNLVESLDFRFARSIDGSGWYPPFRRQDGIVYRWTGPDTVASLDLPLRKEKDLVIQINIIDAMSPELVNTLKVMINGRTIEAKTSRRLFSKRVRTIKGRIPREFLISEKPFTRIDIELKDTISPASMDDRPSMDTRKFGVAIDWMKIFPAR